MATKFEHDDNTGCDRWTVTTGDMVACFGGVGTAGEIIAQLQEQVLSLRAEVERLRAVVGVADLALGLVVGWAKFTRQHWDADHEVKVGKHLIALAGDLPGYAPDTDAIHAYHQQIKAARAVGGD